MKDILIKKLLVDPPGDTIYMNKAVFLDLRAPEFATTPLEKNITINIPKTAVKGSGSNLILFLQLGKVKVYVTCSM